MERILKYPRTVHIRGSGLQKGDEDMETVPFEELVGKYLVVEEKIDGANSGISYDGNWEQWLQSRGHFLTGGPRERHFNLFKTWAATHNEVLLEVLVDRFVAYGEWMFAKHSEFYDLLPHYWLEFDVLDKETMEFLSTERRRELLQDVPVVPVPVVAMGTFTCLEELTSFIKHSLYKSPSWKTRLAEVAVKEGLDPVRVAEETDPSDLAEGLYVKWEDRETGTVKGRYKFVRGEFVQRIIDSDEHWLSRPIVPNQLASGVDIFGAKR